MSELNNPFYETLQQVLNGAQLELPKTVFPDPAELNYYVFANDRKLFLEEDVGFPVMEMIKMIMRWNKEDKDIPVEERKPITVYIMSDGGYLSYMWALVDVMLTSQTPIITVNTSIAASAASLIFLAGSKRYMMPSSTVVIHEGSTEVGGDAGKVMDAIKNYDKEIAKMKDFILKRSTIPSKVLNKKSKDDWYIDAATCLEYGVCHKIVETIDEII